ncbi:MAG: cytochrome P450 [Pirellula sp.]
MRPFPDDPFRITRSQCPILLAEFQGEKVPMLLRHKDVRDAAKDWQRYSSDAPFRVPIPSEEQMRTVRQLPLELDPPLHGVYRKIVEPFFLRSKMPEIQEDIRKLIESLLNRALWDKKIDAIQQFAIPLQSRALCYLLNVSEREAEHWISWGMHVFKDGDGKTKGSQLESYCREMFDRMMDHPGQDFFSALNEARIDGVPLTMEQKLGFANLAFAGGRDTVIHMVTRILVYFASHPHHLTTLRQDLAKIVLASEEFFRVFMPLTHIGRVCPVTTDVFGFEVPAQGRVSLCWASANRDPEVFTSPDEILLDRKPNPHVSFGFGAHLCLGAHHARAIVRGLLHVMATRLESIDVIESSELLEKEASYVRQIGYEKLILQFHGIIQA